MYKQNIPLLLLLSLLVDQPSWSCGGGGTNYKNPTRGKFTQRSSQAILQSKNNAIIETRVIEQYTKLGYQLESQKRWADAEQSFRYVLKVVSRRDGPGSFKSVPALEHLATVSRAQNKLDQAIGFQKTARLLTEAQPAKDQQAMLNSQLTLANLFIQKHDYVGAEAVLVDSIATCNAQTANDAHSSKPLQHRDLTYRAYAKVLRELHKDSDANAIEAAASANITQLASGKPAASEQVILTQNPTSSSLKPQAILEPLTNKNESSQAK